MDTFWTARFEKSYDRCGQKEFVIRAIAELEDYVHQRRMNTRQVKKISGSPADDAKKYGVTLMEWDLNSAGRLIFGLDEKLLLIDFSEAHTCLENFTLLSSSEKGQVFAKTSSLPEFIRNEIDRPKFATPSQLSSLEQVDSGGDRNLFPEEKTRDWVTFLDVPQFQLSKKLETAVVASKGFEVHLILGGAGTGKTMVIRDLCVNLLLRHQARTQLRIPSGVKEFLQSEGAALPGLPPFTGEYAAILVDDPIVISDALDAVGEARRLNIPIVIAIDPIQWHQRLSVEKFEKFMVIEKPFEYELTINYRQGRKVGQPAVDAIKQFRLNTSEFRDRHREQINKAKSAKFERISLDAVRFKEDAGTYAFYSQSEFRLINILKELHRVGRFRTERRWPKVLIGAEFRDSYPFGVPLLIQLYKSLDRTFTYHHRAFSQYREVRGTEYECVIIFVRHSTWVKLVNGVEGAKSDVWEDLNAPLTFLTRAENRCVVFEVPDHMQFLPSKSKIYTDDENEHVNKLFSDWLEHQTKNI